MVNDKIRVGIDLTRKLANFNMNHLDLDQRLVSIGAGKLRPDRTCLDLFYYDPQRDKDFISGEGDRIRNYLNEIDLLDLYDGSSDLNGLQVQDYPLDDTPHPHITISGNMEVRVLL